MALALKVFDPLLLNIEPVAPAVVIPLAFVVFKVAPEFKLNAPDVTVRVFVPKSTVVPVFTLNTPVEALTLLAIWIVLAVVPFPKFQAFAFEIVPPD